MLHYVVIPSLQSGHFLLPWLRYLNAWGFQASYTVACSSVRLNQVFLHNSTQVLCLGQERTEVILHPYGTGGQCVAPFCLATGSCVVVTVVTDRLLCRALFHFLTKFCVRSILKLCKYPPVPYQTSSLLIHLFVWMDSWFPIWWVTIIYSDVQIIPAVTSGSPSTWFLCLLSFFTCPHHSLNGF